MAEEKKENKEKKSDRVPGIDIAGLFKSKPWIFIAAGAVLVVLIVIGVLAFSVNNSGSNNTATVSPGMLTAVIVKGEDRFSHASESGELEGIEPALASRFADAQGLTLKIIEAQTQEEAVSMLDTKAADVAFGRIADTSNLNGYTVSNNYGSSGLFMITALHDYTNALTLMTGYSVGVMNNIKTTAMGTTGYEYITPKDYDNAVKLGEDIRDRALSMGIVSERDAIGLVKSFPNALQTQAIAGSPMEYYVAVFPAGKSVQATIMNGIITGFDSDGSAEAEENS